MRALITVPVPHLLLRSPARPGWRGRKGMWLLPWCRFWGDPHPGTPIAAVGPGEAALRSEGRAASLMRGKCVTSSRLGPFEPHDFSCLPGILGAGD